MPHSWRVDIQIYKFLNHFLKILICPKDIFAVFGRIYRIVLDIRWSHDLNVLKKSHRIAITYHEIVYVFLLLVECCGRINCPQPSPVTILLMEFNHDIFIEDFLPKCLAGTCRLENNLVPIRCPFHRTEFRAVYSEHSDVNLPYLQSVFDGDGDRISVVNV